MATYVRFFKNAVKSLIEWTGYLTAGLAGTSLLIVVFMSMKAITAAEYASIVA